VPAVPGAGAGMRQARSGTAVLVGRPGRGPVTGPVGGSAACLRRGYDSGGYAFWISWWNWAENQWPASGEFGSAPVGLLPLRALPP
jgi:hypothetical protein